MRVRLVLLGLTFPVSAGNGAVQQTVLAMMFEALQYTDNLKLCPFKVGDRGVRIMGGMRLGVSCVISLDNFGRPPPLQPLSVLSPRRHASQVFRNNCLVLDLPGQFVCGYLDRRSALPGAQPSSYIVLVQRASHCQTSRGGSERLDGALWNSPRSPT